MDKLSKLPNETDLAYHKRLIYGKLVDGTLADEDYSELSPYVYGKEYSSDVARRMMYGSRKTLEMLDESAITSVTPSGILSELDARKIEFQKERQKFYDQRREFNKIVTSDARAEHLCAALADAANRLNETIGIVYDESEHYINTDGENEVVLVFSDWHYGMVTNNAFNTYNTDICRQRVKEVVAKARERIVLHRCSKLNVVVLGDLCHGAIHTSARVASEELVCDQIMQVSELLAQSIEELSKYVSEVDVYVTYGNHARTVANKKDNIHRDNMERIVPWWLEQRLRGLDWVTIMPDTGNEFLFIDACGHGISAVHGDLDKVRTSPRLLTVLFQKKFGRDVEYILLGDKHHRESFEELGVDALLCGALCGADDYANEHRLYSTPSQLLLIVNKDVGVDAEYRIKLR